MSAIRKSYSLKFKLDVLNEYEPNVNGKGFAALAKKYNLATITIRGWYKNHSKLLEHQKHGRKSIKISRRLEGGGRHEFFEDVEHQLVEWIKLRNKDGLRVKDKYIQIKALEIAKEQQTSAESEFKASRGWLENFKKRYDLVSRRQTSSRILPDNASGICREFIGSIQKLIQEKSIKKSNVLNMDQVPRYFEGQAKSTITSKGTRNVLIRKASNSHKRFTATFTIGADGKIYKPHLLFSKLKNIPKTNNKCLTDINSTGVY